MSLHAQEGDIVSKAVTDVVAGLVTNTVADSAAGSRTIGGAGLAAYYSSSISGGGGSVAAITGTLSDLNPILYPVLIIVFNCRRRYRIKSCN